MDRELRDRATYKGGQKGGINLQTLATEKATEGPTWEH